MIAVEDGLGKDVRVVAMSGIHVQVSWASTSAAEGEVFRNYGWVGGVGLLRLSVELSASPSVEWRLGTAGVLLMSTVNLGKLPK